MQKIQHFFTGWLKTFQQQGFVGKMILAAFSFLFICILCGVPISVLSPSTPTPETVDIASLQTVAVETAIAGINQTSTANVPTDTPVPTETLLPTEENKALLPGLMPTDVIFNLEQRGFTCGSAEQGQLYYVRSCKNETIDYMLVVDIYGRSAFTVDLIESSVFQFTNPNIEFVASFLGFMATMPYDGAVQEEARDWVESTLPTLTGQGDVREKVFAGVNYLLYGIPTAYTLEMGNLP